MKWLKHMSASWDDEKMAALVGEGGDSGLALYGAYWRIAEIIAAQMEGNAPSCSVSYPIWRWARMLSVRKSYITSILLRLQKAGLVVIEGEVNRDQSVIVKMPNLLKYRDEYARKSGHAPENVHPRTDTELNGEREEAFPEQSCGVFPAENDPPQCKPLAVKEVSEPHQTTPIHALSKKPSRDKREGPSKTDLANSRHAEFKAAIGDYWKAKNPEADMPWDGAEGKGLDDWLKSSPRTSVAQFTSYLRNRYRSDVNHAERPSLWIRNITSFAGGPLDRFGKPPQQGGINGNGHGDTNLAILTESLRADQARLDGNGDLSARDVGQANIFSVLGAAGKRAG